MGISINLNSNVIRRESKSYDKEIIGCIVPSNSGYDYPQVIETYKEFVDIFSDTLGTDLSRYKYLYDYDYLLAPIKISSIDNNYANVVFTSHPNITYYTCDYNNRVKGVSKDTAKKVQREDMTNHFNIRLPNKIKEFDYITFVTGLGKPGFIWFVDNITDKSKVPPLDINTYSGGALKLWTGLSRDVLIDTLTKVFKNTYNNNTSKSFNNNYDVLVQGDDILVYSSKPFPKMNGAKLGGELTSLGINEDLENKVYELYTTDQDIFLVRSLIPGDYGRKITVELSTYQNRLVVKFKGLVVETFNYEEISQLETHSLDSKYIRIEFPDRKITVNPGTYIARLGGNIKDINQENYLYNSIDVFDDEDVDIDIFLYDQKVEPFLTRRMIEIAENKTHLLIHNVDEKDVPVNSPETIYIYGKHKDIDEIEVPNSYLFMHLLKSTYVGNVNNKIILDHYLTSEDKVLLEINNINYIETDGLKYYVNYYKGSYERRNIVYYITKIRIHRRFYSLKEVLGMTIKDVRSKVQEILSDIRTSIHLLEYVTLDKCERDPNDESNCIVQMTYKLPEIRAEVLSMNITLNVTE